MTLALRKNNVLAGAALLILSCAGTAGAQVADNAWSEPFRLAGAAAVPEAPHSIAGDSTGGFHVVWVERGSPDRRIVLKYARFGGVSWSAPSEIYVTKPGLRLGDAQLTIDREDNLHLTWTEADTGAVHGDWPMNAPVMYSRARVDEAPFPDKWSKPRIVDAVALFCKLRVDARGNLHLIYTDRYSARRGIFYRHSLDRGATWSAPVKIDPEVPADRYPWRVQLEVDRSGGLHAAWEYKAGWQTASIHYSRSPDGGGTWLPSVTIDAVTTNPDEIQYGFPLMAVHNETVHLIWAGGGFANVGRRHRYSTDGGATWGPVRQLLGNLHGWAQVEQIAVDERGRVHVADQVRFPAGLYHYYWDGGQWSTPSLLYLIQQTADDPVGDRIHIHNICLGVNGAQLLATFSDVPGPLLAPTYSMHTLRKTVAAVSAASFVPGAALAPESIVAVYGPGLATVTAGVTSLPLPTTLGGTTVTVQDSAGTNLAAPLFFVSPEQVNILLPAGVALGQATLTVKSGDGSTLSGTIRVESVSPGMFMINPARLAAANVVRVRRGGQQFFEPVFQVDPVTSQVLPLPIDMGTDDEQVFLELYGTGIRFRTALSAVTATVGGLPATVAYAGPQGTLSGLDQVNILLPPALRGRGNVDIVLRVDDKIANVVNVTVK